MPFFPRWVEPILFGLFLTALMSLVVAGVTTFRNVGPVENFVELWMLAWLPSWAVAFPTVLVVAPLVRRFLRRIVKPA